MWTLHDIDLDQVEVAARSHALGLRPRTLLAYFADWADAQVDALRTAGADRVFIDIASGATQERTGDTLVVWRLDRLGRSLAHLIEIVSLLSDRDIDFKSLTEGFDTSTAGGQLVFHIFGAGSGLSNGRLRPV